jgi:hypothetical protein
MKQIQMRPDYILNAGKSEKLLQSRQLKGKFSALHLPPSGKKQVSRNNKLLSEMP